MGKLLSNPNGVFLTYASSHKTLGCLKICETIVISVKGKYVSQRLPLACQLGFFLTLLPPWILHHFYTEGESVRKQCTFLRIKCGCHEN